MCASADRPTTVSIHATSIAAKEAERQRLAADVEAFQRKRGKRIEVLPAFGAQAAPQPGYREAQARFTEADRQRAADRRRRSAAHA